MEKPASPIRPTDDEARALARQLLSAARFASIGTVEPETGHPVVTRIAMVLGPDGVPLSAISTLSNHTAAITANPACSLLIGEPGAKGDPLTHPRLTIQAVAEQADKAALRDHYLSLYPKATLYFDFTDFQLYAFRSLRAYLNGGFGKAFILTPEDMLP